MKALTTAQNKQYDDYFEKLVDLDSELDVLASKYRDLEVKWQELLDVQIKVNRLIPDIVEFVKDISEQMALYMSEKSQKWHDTNTGQDYEDWRRDWANAAVLISKLDLEEASFPSVWNYIGIPALEILLDLNAKRVFKN